MKKTILKDRYLALAREHSERLVRGGYLLADDVPQVMKRMEEQWAQEQQVGTND